MVEVRQHTNRTVEVLANGRLFLCNKMDGLPLLKFLERQGIQVYDGMPVETGSVGIARNNAIFIATEHGPRFVAMT